MDNKIQHNSLLNYLQKVIAVFLISIFYASLVTAQPSSAPDYKSWKQIQKKDNIVAYIGTTKVKTATPIKVEMTVDATPKEVVDAIKDFETHYVWIPYCTKSYLVEQITENDFYGYYYFTIPIVSNRDAYVHSTTIETGENSYKITIEGIADYKSDTKAVVRIPHTYSHYYISVDSNGSTQLTHINETLFGGKIPTFLMDWANYSQPFHTMKTLRDHIINKKLKPTNIQNK